MERGFYICLLWLFAWGTLVASPDPARYEASRNDTDLMFYIQRNVDDRQVHYTLNRGTDGQLDLTNPFQIFWMSASGDGERRNLNILQRHFVYGVKVENAAADRIEFQLAAYPELSLFLQNIKEKYQVHTTIAGEWCVLESIHVQLEDDNVFSPTVVFVRLEGTNAEGQRRVGRIDNQTANSK